MAAVGSTGGILGLESPAALCGVRGRALWAQGEGSLCHSPLTSCCALVGELGLSITHSALGRAGGDSGVSAAHPDTVLAGSHRPNKLFVFPGYLMLIQKAKKQLCYSLGYHLPRCLLVPVKRDRANSGSLEVHVSRFCLL